MRYGSIFIDQDPNELNPELDPPGWAWLKPTADGLELYTYEDNNWVLKCRMSLTDHSHENLEHLGDIVTLLNNGVTGTKTVGGYTLTFNHGVLTNFETV